MIVVFMSRFRSHNETRRFTIEHKHVQSGSRTFAMSMTVAIARLVRELLGIASAALGIILQRGGRRVLDCPLGGRAHHMDARSWYMSSTLLRGEFIAGRVQGGHERRVASEVRERGHLQASTVTRGGIPSSRPWWRSCSRR